MKKNYKFNTIKISSSDKLIPAGTTDETLNKAYNTASIITNGGIIIKGGINISTAQNMIKPSLTGFGSSLAGTISYEKTNDENIDRDYSFFGYIDNDGTKIDFGGDKGQKGQIGQKGEKGYKGLKGIKGIKGYKGNLGEEGVPFQIIYHGILNDELINEVENNKYPKYEYENGNTNYHKLEGNEPFNPNNNKEWEGHFIYTQIITDDKRDDTSFQWNGSTLNSNDPKYNNINNNNKDGSYKGDLISWNGVYWSNYGRFEGVKGKTGSKGNTGQEGQKGNKDEKGQKGENGKTGENGLSIKGDNGNKGQKGNKGETGKDGYFTKGDKGNTGEIGDKGNNGKTGDKGQKGQKGDKGQRGKYAIFNAGKEGEVDCNNNSYYVDSDLNFKSDIIITKDTDTDRGVARSTLSNICNVNNIILAKNETDETDEISYIGTTGKNDDMFSGIVLDHNSNMVLYSSNMNSDETVTRRGSIPNYNAITDTYPSIKGSLFTMGSDTTNNKFYISWHTQSGTIETHSFKSDTESNSFTGQHIVRPIDKNININIDKHIGKIVCSTENFDNYPTTDNLNDINNSLPIVELSNKAYSKNVYGIITNKINNKTDKYINEEYYKKGYILVNSLGDGGIWILNNDTVIENGDYLVTSNVPGIAMKQNDNIKHNYTIAKITQNFNFDVDTYDEMEYNNTKHKIAFVGCIYCMN